MHSLEPQPMPKVGYDCNGDNLPNLAEEKACCKISQNQICVDLLQVTAS